MVYLNKLIFSKKKQTVMLMDLILLYVAFHLSVTVCSQIERTGSVKNGPAHGSEPLSSPAPVGQRAGIWRVVAGKNKRAHLRFFHLNWPEILFGRPERINRMFRDRGATLKVCVCGGGGGGGGGMGGAG